MRMILAWLLVLPLSCFATLKVGVAQKDITPPVLAPSAGSFDREGGMQGIHDPLLAQAMVVDNGDKILALCSVDHLGFLHDMIEDVQSQVHASIPNCEIFISSTHTHSGGGGYMNIPDLGELIAGPYDPKLVKIYVDGTANAIIQAAKNLQPAKIGIGYSKVEGLTSYGGVYPKNLEPPTDLTVIKATKLDGTPLAVFFNYSLYPDILATDACPEVAMLFSADVVGYARDHIKTLIGGDVTPIFFNGAKGELIGNIPYPDDLYKSCDTIGKSLAVAVNDLWKIIQVKDTLKIDTYKDSYTFEAKPTPSGYLIPFKKYPTEMNLIVLDKSHPFITIPAELSCSYDPVLKAKAKKMGYDHLTILDIVNDNHGYIYSPKSFRLKPDEVEFSWGGENYGQEVENKVIKLLSQTFRE